MNNPYLNQLQYSRITDRNIYPSTDALYNPLRKVLLRPQQVAINHPYLNPAAAQSRVTRDFAYLTERQVRGMREHTLIPVDQPLYATYDLDKVKNSRFMVVDAHEQVVGTPITVEEMQRIRAQGMKEQRIVYDFGQRNVIVEPQQPRTRIIQQHRVIDETTPATNIDAPTVMRQTKIIKQELKTSYRPPQVNQNQYAGKNSSGMNKQYKYNLYSMLDQGANGEGWGCAGNQFIASRNQPQSINWLH